MKKMMLLALAVASVAMFALPAVASAGTWHIEPEGGAPTEGNPFSFTAAGGEGALTTAGSEPITCSSVSGAGNYTNTTTGHIELTFHGCKTKAFGITVNCTTSGQPTGTITTTALEFHNIMSGNSTAILITPNTATNQFAHFSCSFVSVTVVGNGIIGTITNPNCGETSTTANVSFTSSSPGVQTDRTITSSGTEYTLERNNGETASEDASATITFPEPAKKNCT